MADDTVAALREYCSHPCVMCFGLSDDELSVVRGSLPTSDSIVFQTDCPTDLIAYSPAIAVIFDTDMMNSENAEMLWAYYFDVTASETVVAIGHKCVPTQLQTRVLSYPDFGSFAPNLKYVLLNAQKKSRKDKAFSNTLATAIQILQEIKVHPGVSTRQLADKTEMSVRSVQRYIETLRVAGEWIDYDMCAKGWRLGIEGRSVLMGEF